MFDPFNDFESVGYLQNSGQFKDLNKIKTIEHSLFKKNLNRALKFLATKKFLFYSDYLNVHRILFSEFYPWAGQDRLNTNPELAISKSNVMFCHPKDCERVISTGLSLGQDIKYMKNNLGEVMGLFAYAHPFLDGNGRTMFVVHSELCKRAGFSIDWISVNNSQYLEALSLEITNPNKKILDQFLLPFKSLKVNLHTN